MRALVMALAVLFVTAVAAGAQTTPARPVDGANAKLDQYLRSWEQEMRKIQTLQAVLTRTDKDKVFQTASTFTGYAQYMKSGTGPTAMNMALMEMKVAGKNDMAEKFICTGTFLYQFLPAQKEIRRYELPRPKPGQVADDNFLTFLFGMKADEAKKRYALTLTNESKWYIYIEVAPRFAADKADFTRARLVLNRDTYLPRQLWFEHGNGNEVTWEIPRLQPGVELNRRLFDAPATPPGWKVVPINRTAAAASNVPPTVVRPKN